MRPTRPPQPPQPMPPAAHYGPPQAPRSAPPTRSAPPPSAWRETTAPTQAAQLLCPKCHGLLVTYERQGVHLEQCRDCRGIWLDRGELDRLIDAEAAFVEAPAYQAPSRQGTGQARWDDGDDDRRRREWDDDDDDDRGRRRRDDDDDDRRGRPSRRRSMFGDLFEGLIE